VTNRDKFLASHMTLKEVVQAKELVAEWKARHEH